MNITARRLISAMTRRSQLAWRCPGHPTARGTAAILAALLPRKLYCAFGPPVLRRKPLWQCHHLGAQRLCRASAVNRLGELWVRPVTMDRAGSPWVVRLGRGLRRVGVVQASGHGPLPAS